MTVNSLKDLEKLIKLCRRTGVQSIKIDNIEFRLDDAAPQAPTKRSNKATIEPFAPGGITESTQIDTPDALTPEQLLMWSSAPGGVPDGNYES